MANKRHEPKGIDMKQRQIDVPFGQAFAGKVRLDAASGSMHQRNACGT